MFFFFVIITAFLSLSNSHLFSKPDDIHIPEIISEFSSAFDDFINYVNEVNRNLEENPNNFLPHISLLRVQNHSQSILENFKNKINTLKEDTFKKVLHEAIEVADVNKEVLTDLVKTFKYITNKVKNGAQIVDMTEVTKNIVLYINIILSNQNNDPSYKEKADHIYEKVKDEISKGSLRDNKKENEDLRRYLSDINQQMNLLQSKLKVVVHEAIDVAKAMANIIKLKPTLEKQFNNTDIHKNN